MALIYPEGTQQKLIGKARYEFSSLSQYSETTSEYEWWSENYNRQSATSDLFIWSVMPCYELPNGPYVGVRLKVNSYKHAKGLLHFRPNANNTYDLGTTSLRWRNIYTNDLNLSNEGSSNDVDGTWGDWTIQEGESDLFLKNNRSGKKYKFNLTEVS